LALAYTLLHSAEMLGGSLGWSHGLLRLFTLLLILGVPVVIIVSWYHGARGQRGVSGMELMIIRHFVGNRWNPSCGRDSKTEHASEGAASAAGEHGAESGAQKKSHCGACATRSIRCGTRLFRPLGGRQSRLLLGRDRGGNTQRTRARQRAQSGFAHVLVFSFASPISVPSDCPEARCPAISSKASVRRAGDTVRITAQLIDASNRPARVVTIFRSALEHGESVRDTGRDCQKHCRSSSPQRWAVLRMLRGP